MQGIKEREFRDSGSNANIEICFEVRVTALRSRLHTEGFPLFVHTGLPTQGTSTEGLGNTTLEYTTPFSNKYNIFTRGKAQQLSPLHLEGKAQSQSNGKITTLGDHKDHKPIFLTK